MRAVASLGAVMAVSVCLPTSTSRASEGDVLLDVGPSVTFFGGSARQRPGIGAQLALFWGMNDQTDIGLFAKMDRSGAKAEGADSIVTTMAGLSSWLTPYSGTIRPQVGGQIGYGNVEGSSFLHLAVQARALMEISTPFRLFVGGTAGALLGDGGTGFASADLGLQFLF